MRTNAYGDAVWPGQRGYSSADSVAMTDREFEEMRTRAMDAKVITSVQGSCPPPGVYEDVPFETYLKWDAISSSRINLARRSLAHFKANAAIEPTPSLRLGALVHCGQLEPLHLAKRYAVMPAFERDDQNRTKLGERSTSTSTVYYQRKKEEFTNANTGKEFVTAAAYDHMVAMVTALSKHERARTYLETPGQIEVAIVWADPDTGLNCKARIDHLGLAARQFTDLKTFSPQIGCLPPSVKFSRSIANFGYHRQMAHYRNGLLILTGELLTAAIVAVDSNAPYCVMAAPFGAEWMEIGSGEVSHTLRMIADSYESNDWPGYDSPESWVPPAWYGDDGEEINLVVNGKEIAF